MTEARVRRMGPTDIDSAVALVQSVGWAFAPADFEAMLKLEPDGLFVVDAGAGEDAGDAEDGGGEGAGRGEDGVVGLTTTARYDGVGWIGNVVVAEDRRGEGLGTALVEAAIAHLRDDGADLVGLYALPDSLSLYERLGFTLGWDVVLMTGDAAGHDAGPADPVDPPGPALEPADAADLDHVLALDAAHAVPDRSRVLGHLAGLPSTRVLANDHAYLFARPGKVVELGPAVCDPDRPEAFAPLLDAALADATGPVEAAFPVANAAAAKAYGERGLEEGFRATAMTLGADAADGPEALLYDPRAVFGLLGLETG